MNETPIIIQINSVKALERLLGDGDNEFTMAVRNSVAQAFANRHFNALSKMPEIEAAVRESKELAKGARQEILNKSKRLLEEELGIFIKQANYPYSEVLTLNPSTIEKLKAITRSEVSDIILNTVKEYLNELNIPLMVTKQVDYQIETGVQKKIKEGVETALNKIKNNL